VAVRKPDEDAVGDVDPGSVVRAGGVSRLLASLVVRLRWLILAAWVAAAGYVTVIAPVPAKDPGASVVSLVPRDSEAVALQERAVDLFRIPVATQTAVVRRDPDGLSLAEQRFEVERAIEHDRRVEAGESGVEEFFALPITNAAGLVPGSREANTTAVTYLAFGPEYTAGERQFVAERYAAPSDDRGGDDFVGVTGIVSAQLKEGTLIDDALPLIELATVLLIALVVGLKFRAPGAPLLTLATVAIAYVVSNWALERAAQHADVSVPAVLEPLLIALVLGIVTDYSVFYLSSCRARLRRAEGRLDAARSSTAEIAPIIVAGGLILAVGLLSLLGASVSFFRTLGPGLALTVLVSLLVAVTFIPAALATFGRALFWPSRVAPEVGGPRPGHSFAERLARFGARRPVAAVVVLVCGAGLVVAALQLTHARLGFTNITGLPADAEERRAAEEAGKGFADGIVSPSQVILEGDGIVDRRAELVRFEGLLAEQPGVAAVIGPREQPTGPRGFVLAEDGSAARYFAILDDEPLSAGAIATVGTLEDGLRPLLDEAGLGDVRAGIAGDTAVAHETVRTFRGDLARVGGLVLVINFVLLVVFLRAVVAPLFLVAASALAVAATFGITAWVFQDVLGYGQLTYYVPFAVAVLLVSLGSDYNVFVTGRVWQEARVRPLQEAVAVAAPRAASAIRAAGITLALSFAALAIVPLHAFWEFAFAMTVGILVETFVVRSLLVPALVSVFGYASGWPGGALRLRRRPGAQAAGD
jgi:putative drug exporter of the RND superfamily